MVKDTFLPYVVLNLLKLDLAALIDGIVYRIDDNEDLFIFQLVSAVNNKIALQLTCFVDTGKSRQLCDKLVAF